MLKQMIFASATAILTLVAGVGSGAQRLPGGGGGAALLRYRFVAGQRFTYQVMSTQHIIPVTSSASHIGQLGAAESIIEARVNGSTTGVLSGTLHEHIVSVDQNGVARIALSIDHLLVTTNGQPASLDQRQSFGTVTIAPDGSQRTDGDGRVTGGAVASGPILPPYPIGRGGRWSNTVKVLVPGVDLLVRPAVSEDTLEGFGQADGEPVAVTGAVIPLHARANISLGNTSVHVEESGRETLRFLLGLDSGQVISSQGRITAHVSVRQDGGLFQETVVVETSQRRTG